MTTRNCGFVYAVGDERIRVKDEWDDWAMSRLGPALDARASFRITRSALFELLSQFDAADWTSVTAAAPWTVHDVVAHLLGDDVLRLSRSRDAHWLAPELGLPASLHRANAQWVAAFQSVSPQVLVDLLHVSSQEIAGYWDSVNLVSCAVDSL